MSFFREDFFKVEKDINSIVSALFVAPAVFVVSIADKLTWGSSAMLKKWALSSLVTGAVFTILMVVINGRVFSIDTLVMVLGTVIYLMVYLLLLGIKPKFDYTQDDSVDEIMEDVDSLVSDDFSDSVDDFGSIPNEQSTTLPDFLVLYKNKYEGWETSMISGGDVGEFVAFDYSMEVYDAH